MNSANFPTPEGLRLPVHSRFANMKRKVKSSIKAETTPYCPRLLPPITSAHLTTAPGQNTALFWKKYQLRENLLGF